MRNIEKIRVYLVSSFEDLKKPILTTKFEAQPHIGDYITVDSVYHCTISGVPQEKEENYLIEDIRYVHRRPSQYKDFDVVLYLKVKDVNKKS